ncbi:nucleotidyltransferase family protein [Neomicrococcus aestuarii]|uniref:MobA-like NTP transferase domain-containing protein n=1 Tax=Neomicrococcus aestuarii TaxID=556325 RepID=A0A1L2ZMJ9_9MICC|nr:nucleotidyltransferase family protein [Neomicrococcus aestuarii]APF40614.1 hypothetical protein BHE16_05810 [Neomicrococcus aestuarii]
MHTLPNAPEETTGRPGASMQSIAAVVMAGGAGSRMGGVNKPLLRRSGITLLGGILDAINDTFGTALWHTVVVGPQSLDQELSARSNTTRVQESPVLAGPAAAAACATESLANRAQEAGTQPDVVALLAADFVDPSQALTRMRHEIERHPGRLVVPRDSQGYPQWLMSAVPYAQLLDRVAEERAASAAEHSGKDPFVGQSLRWILGADTAVFVDLPASASDATQDIDSPEDARHFGIDLP